MFERIYFEEALKLAHTVKGSTSPNPAVGAVVVRDDTIVGRGATRKAGQEHAEILAIRDAGNKCHGSTMYVTLEPCVMFPGKHTASCAQAIIDAGIAEVIIGMRDPNPHINGKGIELLEKAGVSTKILHERESELRELNEDFFKFISTGIPYTYAKYAMTLDGNIANIDGDSQWVSGEESLKWVHNFRNRVDAIMIGIGTVLKDNPRLNVRLVPVIKNPLRVIIDPKGETPSGSHVMADEGQTLFVISPDAPQEFRDTCEHRGKRFVEFPAPFDMKSVTEYLGKTEGIESLFIEGGGRLFYSALQAGIIDKVFAIVAPKILGGKGIQPFEGETKNPMSRALKLKDISVENIEGDVIIKGYL
jgi:diaminohydroxyphosphoribosylaminopyrimidine deaminase/5-amino-6-(5-phosphoribosylamino)uracil reductase